MYKRGDIVEIVGSTKQVYSVALGPPDPVMGLTGTILRPVPNMEGFYEIMIKGKKRFRWYIYQGDIALVANKFQF